VLANLATRGIVANALIGKTDESYWCSITVSVARGFVLRTACPPRRVTSIPSWVGSARHSGPHRHRLVHHSLYRPIATDSFRRIRLRLRIERLDSANRQLHARLDGWTAVHRPSRSAVSSSSL